jgi:regulator of cell morphogenesis and NO signaling
MRNIPSDAANNRAPPGNQGAPMLSEQMTVAELLRKYPTASGILERHRIDYCCGGNRSLAEACSHAGVSPKTLLADLSMAGAAPKDAVPPPSRERPLDEIVSHILDHHHVRLKNKLPKLRAMTIKVAAVHGKHRPEFVELARVFAEFADEAERHLDHEKRIVFPWLLSGRSRSERAPINLMRSEHRRFCGQLDLMRKLCADYAAPDHACNTWRGLYTELEALDRELREHIELEDNAIFPSLDPSGSAVTG